MPLCSVTTSSSAIDPPIPMFCTRVGCDSWKAGVANKYAAEKGLTATKYTLVEAKAKCLELGVACNAVTCDAPPDTWKLEHAKKGCKNHANGGDWLGSGGTLAQCEAKCAGKDFMTFVSPLV